jgi:hypothetical protein
MTDKLLTMREAALHTGLPHKFFQTQLMNGQGPAFVVPGKRTKFFRVTDLDRWMETWQERTVQTIASAALAG